MKKYCLAIILACFFSLPFLSYEAICQTESKSTDFSTTKSPDGLVWTVTFNTDQVVRIVENYPIGQGMRITNYEKGELKWPNVQDPSILLPVPGPGILMINDRGTMKSLDLKYKKGGVITIQWTGKEPTSETPRRAPADSLAERTKPAYEKARAEIAAIDSKAKTSKAAFDAFMKKTQSKKLVKNQELETNPFIYKGQVVAINTTFKKMYSESEAIFGGVFGNTLFISNVPPTKFTGNTSVIIAARVIGTKNIGGPTIPHLKYIDSRICPCDDLLYWEEQANQDIARVNRNLNSALNTIKYKFEEDLNAAAKKYFTEVGSGIMSRILRWMEIHGKNDLCQKQDSIFGLGWASLAIQLTLANGTLGDPRLLRTQDCVEEGNKPPSIYIDGVLYYRPENQTARDAFNNALGYGVSTPVPDIMSDNIYQGRCHLSIRAPDNWSVHCFRINR